MKPVFWVGDSKKRLLTFPPSVRHEIGFILEGAQAGLTHHKAKLLRGFSGVYEIVSNYDRNTYRTIYAVNLGERLLKLPVTQGYLVGFFVHPGSPPVTLRRTAQMRIGTAPKIQKLRQSDNLSKTNPEAGDIT